MDRSGRQRRVLVTGGSGFIGTAVCRELLRRNHQVDVFDLKPPTVAGVGFVRGDILDSTALAAALQGHDGCIHLAAVLGVQRTDADPLGTLTFDLEGTRRVLDAASVAGVKRFGFASSSEVYGEPDRVPIREDDKKGPKSVYGIAKLASEAYVHAYHVSKGMGAAITRLFNVYGPGQPENFAMSAFAKGAVEGRIRVFGDGTQVRAFCHVEDAARGIVGAFDSDLAFGTYNIGNPAEPIEMAALADLMSSLSGNRVEIVREPFDATKNRAAEREIQRRVPSIDRARGLLGYEPRVPLKEGAASVLAHWRGRR